MFAERSITAIFNSQNLNYHLFKYLRSDKCYLCLQQKILYFYFSANFSFDLKK